MLAVNIPANQIHPGFFSEGPATSEVTEPGV